MESWGNFLSILSFPFLSFILMIVLSIFSFFFTVNVVDFVASLAGDPDNQYTVLSAALLVAAAILRRRDLAGRISK